MTDDTDLHQETIDQPEVQRHSRIGWAFLIICGILLPTITLVVETLTHMCRDTFFDPIPNPGHWLLIAMVPISNALLVFTPPSLIQQRLKWFGWLNTISLCIALYYTLLFLPLVPLSAMAILFFGMGLLPLSPLLALIATWLIRKGLKRSLGDKADQLPNFWRGIALASVTLLAINVPAIVTRIGVEMAIGESPSLRQSGITLLRAVGSNREMLKLCYADQGRSNGLFDLTLLEADLDQQERIREVFYRVTGTAYFEHKLPIKQSIRDWASNFDEQQGGQMVGGKILGVKLSRSQIDGTIDQRAATAYLEWTMNFKNDTHQLQEGRGQIVLPPGAVVSRVNLWINGEAKEAAFGGRGQVRQAYEKIVRQQRDPLLVTSAGPDRVQFQLFPIPTDGQEMTIRIGMSVPLQVMNQQSAQLQLPALLDRNFELPTQLRHAISLQSDSALMHSTVFQQRASSNTAYHIEGALPDEQLGRRASLVTIAQQQGTSPAWQLDTLAKPAAVVIQRMTQTPAWRPKRVALVIDGSAAMKTSARQLDQAMRNLPADLEWQVVVAGDQVPKLQPLKPVDGHTLATILKQVDFSGGQDNLPALIAAWDWVAQSERGAVVWLHGTQSITLTQPDNFQHQMRQGHGDIRLYSLQMVAGSNRLLTALDGIATLHPIPRLDTPQADLNRLLQSWLPGTQAYTLNRERVMADVVDQSALSTPSEHLVRLWASDEIHRLSQSRQAGAYQTAATTAQRYQLVTAVSSAVVLETRQQYDEAGLEPVSPGTVPTVPEPETWVLIIVVISVLTWQARRLRKDPY
ncbi:VIT domain-containing protein [Chitinivorax sp. B]|uniref:VIT domain-containing protein n=1 Tax=Chitinivorax sp. B TaxID=2502235 RepID=UPI0014855C9C|nr:VIT domain-containing protein [Chitinivorax sp. B]